MKRALFVIIMCGVIVASMSGCGNTGSDDDRSDKKQEATAAQEETKPADETQADTAETTTAAKEEPAVAVSALKEVGTLPGTDCYFDGIAVYKKDSDGKKIFCDYLGNELEDGEVVDVSQLTNNTDLYKITVAKDDMLYSGIINGAGEVILPISEKVNMIDEMDNNSRYLVCAFGEEETTDRNEAIFFMSSNMFASLSGPGEEDKMYKGHFEIYDTEKKKFLSSFNVTENVRPQIGGTLLSYTDSDYNQVVIDAEKDSVLPLNKDQYRLSSVITENKSDNTVVYDKDLNWIFEFEGSLFGLDNTSDYLVFVIDSKHGVMDTAGNIIIQPEYEHVDYLGGDLFACGDDMNNCYLVDKSGNRLTDEMYDIGRYNPVFDVIEAKNTYANVLIASDGTLVGVLDSDEYFSSPYSIEKNGVKYYYCKNDKDFTIKADGYPDVYGDHYLVDNENKIVFDIDTGGIVMEGFDRASIAYGYLYITEAGVTTIYKE